MSPLQQFLELVESHDVLALMLLIGIVRLVGGIWGTDDSRLRQVAARCGYAVFLLYSINRISQEGIVDPLALCGIAARGILAAGVIHGTALLLLAPLIRVWKLASDASRQFKIPSHSRPRTAKQHPPPDRIDDELRREQEHERKNAERELREREARRLEAEEAARVQAAEVRREAAAWECQLLYDRHAVALRDLLPRERFEVLVAQSLPSSIAAELIDSRAGQVRELIQELLAETRRGKQTFRSLVEIAEHFEERRRQIDESAFDIRTKNSLKAATFNQEDITIQEFTR